MNVIEPEQHLTRRMLGILQRHLEPTTFSYVTESLLSPERTSWLRRFVDANNGWKKGTFTKKELINTLESHPSTIGGLIRRVDANLTIHEKFIQKMTDEGKKEIIKLDKEQLLHLRNILEELKEHPSFKALVVH